MDAIPSSDTAEPLLASHYSSRSSSQTDSMRRRRRRSVSGRKEPKPTTPKDVAKQTAVLISFLISCFLIDRFVYLVLQDSIDPFHETNLRGGEQSLVEQQLLMPQQQPIIEGEYYDNTEHRGSSISSLTEEEQRTLPFCVHCNDTFPLFFFGANDCTELTSEQYVEFCNSDTTWIENKFCQQSCFNYGISYDGEPACCGSSAPTSSPTISHYPSTSPPSWAPSVKPSNQPSDQPPSSSPRPTGSPTKQAFMPSGAMKYNNSEPKIGPWAECLGWDGQDCREYIATLVDDTPKFEFFGVRWQTLAENTTTGGTDPVEGEETIHNDGEGGNYQVIGPSDESGSPLDIDRGPILMHRVVVTVNEVGIVIDVPRRG